ncbi:MAG: DsbC family protein [Gammaproteobacteria bacterium]|nr:MAG: DsbC family protein [Gammaproteobacteria bacterium]
MLKYTRFLIMAVAMLVSGFSIASKADDYSGIKKSISTILPGKKVDVISPSPVDGVYEVVVGARLLYFSENGQFMLDGDLFDITERKDLSAPVRENARAKVVTDAVAKGGITYKTKDEPKYKVTVFTDIDCGYCRKLHNDMDGYLNHGIEVSYLFMPRAGLQSNSFRKAVSAVCADDPNKALTELKNGKTVADKSCDNKIADQYNLAREIGIRGTPGIITEEGKIFPGYLPPDTLLQRLKK